MKNARRLSRSRISRLVAVTVSSLVAITPALVANPPAPAAEKYGTITGHVVWGGKGIPEAKVLVKKGDQGVKDAAVCAATELKSKELTVDAASLGVADAIVYILKPTGTNPEAEKALLEKTPEVIMDQINCEYVPYTTAIHTGQKITFKSSDPVGHNVHYTVFGAPGMNTMLPANGKITKTFKEAPKRVIPVVCDIHPWMKGQFQVFDHPFFAVTKADGSFEIKGVPAGTQNLIVFHSTKGYINEGKAKGQPVEVKAGEATDLGSIKLGE
ncbi:carboxypeptidase regulatory-like domain-containing protein [Tundrisphaera sp. TA3]|uniref:carboxypeptidase regulatory-like domain-containing protein n=1 Tax=Tundrisphaera sp. TA3 TaxID=3435775 RepID=UPI003EB6F331